MSHDSALLRIAEQIADEDKIFFMSKLRLLKENKQKKLSAGDLFSRVTGYIQSGGLFNPELMEHDKVRDLLIDCRDYLRAELTPAPWQEVEARIKARTQPDEPTVCELAICEATRVVLKPDQLYRFTVREGCAACHDAALADSDGRKPPF
jgi:hypothetical protein